MAAAAITRATTGLAHRTCCGRMAQFLNTASAIANACPYLMSIVHLKASQPLNCLEIDEDSIQKSCLGICIASRALASLGGRSAGLGHDTQSCRLWVAERTRQIEVLLGGRGAWHCWATFTYHPYLNNCTGGGGLPFSTVTISTIN